MRGGVAPQWLERERTWCESPAPHSVCDSPDGRTVASGGKSLTLFDPQSWTKGVSLKGHSHETRASTFSPDGIAAAIVGTNLGLTVVDVATGKVSARGPSVGRKPRAVELSPDSARLYLLASNPDELVVSDLC